MNYIINSKNRKFKYKLHLLLDRLSFNFLNIGSSQKITLFGGILSFIGLFLNWFSYDYSGIIKNNSFSVNCGYVGYFIILILIFLVFLILSNTNKEKLKSKTNIIFHDYTIFIFSGILIILLSIVIFNTITGLSKVTQNLSLGKGIILEIIGGLFIFVGGIVNYKETRKEILSKTYIENSKFEIEKDLDEYKQILNSGGQNSNDGNMKLPI